MQTVRSTSHSSCACRVTSWRDGRAWLSDGRSPQLNARSIDRTDPPPDPFWVHPPLLRRRWVAVSRPAIRRGRELAQTALSIGEGGRAAAILTRLASAAEWQGKPALAESLLEQGEALAVQNGLRSTLLLARFYRLRLHWMRGEFEAVESGARDVVSDAIEEGDGNLALATLRLLGETPMEEGRFA